MTLPVPLLLAVVASGLMPLSRVAEEEEAVEDEKIVAAILLILLLQQVPLLKVMREDDEGGGASLRLRLRLKKATLTTGCVVVCGGGGGGGGDLNTVKGASNCTRPFGKSFHVKPLTRLIMRSKSPQSSVTMSLALRRPVTEVEQAESIHSILSGL